ncbi:integrin alpha-D-like, partial [Mustelus asterias]
ATQVDCSSDVNSTVNLTGIFSCNISHPIFHAEATAMFLVMFEVSDFASWGKEATIGAEGNSENDDSILDNNSHSLTIPVLYAVKIIVSRVTCTRYINILESVKQDSAVRHVYKVENLGIHDVPVNVTFEIPQNVAGLIRWDVKNPIPNLPVRSVECVTLGEQVGDSPQGRREDLTASLWTNIFCHVPILLRNTSIEFTLDGPAHSIGKKVASDVKLVMQSSAQVSLDKNKFVDIYSPRSHRAQARTEIEIHKYHSQLPLVCGGSAAGFVLLILIIVILYKVGFFNRSFKEKICVADDVSMKPNTADDAGFNTPDDQTTVASSDPLHPRE